MSSSENDSDAPETVSLKTAKQTSKEQSRREADHAKELARLKKQKHQARDARIKAEKEAAMSSKLKSKQKHSVASKASQESEDADDDEQRRLLERMNRAMKEAEDSDGTMDEDSEDEQLLGDVEMAVGESDSDDSEGGSVSEEQEATNPDYLPDHYFTEAVASLSAPKVSKKVSKKAEGLKRKRKHRKNKEEHVVGSRTIRTIQSATPAAAHGRTTPSSRTNKFLQKQLKGDAKLKGWERKSVVLSSMVSRSGPARRFVRG